MIDSSLIWYGLHHAQTAPLRYLHGAQQCSEGHPDRCGFLRKRGRQERLLENLHLSRHINWRQKFVVVKEGCCYCFDDEVAKSPCQSFSLEGFYRVFRHKAERAAFVFAVEPSEGKLQVFAASSEDDRMAWMMALRQAILEANPGHHISASGGSHHGEEKDVYSEIEKPVFEPPKKQSDAKDGSGSGGFPSGGGYNDDGDDDEDEDIEEESDSSDDYDQPDEEWRKPEKPPPTRRSLPLPPVPGEAAREDHDKKRGKIALPLPPHKPQAPHRDRQKLPDPEKARTVGVRPVPALKPSRKLSEKDCLFDNSDREAAIEILKEKEELGTFLIRKSRQGDNKVLVVMTSEGVREYKIFAEAGQVTLDKKAFFPNVDDLLQHFSKSPLPNRTQTLGRRGVTHVVTQYTDHDQVVGQLERDGVVTSTSSQSELDDVSVVSLSWLSACLKAGKAVSVEEKHWVKKRKQQTPQEGSREMKATVQGRAPQQAVAPWACQRVTPLTHCNHKLTDALEILEKHAQFRSEPSDESRALAFRRASCVLKSLTFQVQRLSQVEGLKDIGGHARKVIQSILDDGRCEEVHSIVSSQWFTLMEEFTSVYGVGPATAKKWIEKGWKSIDDVRKSGTVFKDERIVWGLACHEDLTRPVSTDEAQTFVGLVRAEAEKIRPRVITTLTGGFRRGKSSGHDVDILLSHPTEGEEEGLLPALLQALERRGLVLMGQLEASTYTPGCLRSDARTDHYEKWLGMCKFPKNIPAGVTSQRTGSAASGQGVDTSDAKPGEVSEQSRGGAEATKKTDSEHETEMSLDQTGQSKAGEVPDNSGLEAKKNALCTDETEAPRVRSLEALGEDTRKTLGEGTRKERGEGEEENTDLQPKVKRARTSSSPRELADSARPWRVRRVDLIVAPYSQYWYALVGWTGNKQFNRDLRTYCKKELDMKLTSHGLWDNHTQESLPARSEEEVFKNLKLEYKEPAHRNC